MYIIELIIALQANDFSIPPQEEIYAAVKKAQECQQSSEYNERCANLLDKLVHKKYQLGGIYANFQ